jgi:hypothetical protein
MGESPLCYPIVQMHVCGEGSSQSARGQLFEGRAFRRGIILVVEIPAEHDEVEEKQPGDSYYRQLQRKAQCLSEMDPQRLRFWGELHKGSIGI